MPDLLRPTRFETVHVVEKTAQYTSTVRVQISTSMMEPVRWHAMVGGDGGIVVTTGESPMDAKTKMVAALRKIADELERAK